MLGAIFAHPCNMFLKVSNFESEPISQNEQLYVFMTFLIAKKIEDGSIPILKTRKLFEWARAVARVSWARK